MSQEIRRKIIHKHGEGYKTICRQCNISVTVIALCLQAEMKHTEKSRLYLLRDIEESRPCSGAAVLRLAFFEVIALKGCATKC